MTEPPAETTEVTRSTRDYDDLHRRLNAWIRTKLPGADPAIDDLVVPETNGMSSETVLFTLVSTGTAGRESVACVARIAPQAQAVPVFPDYDFVKQYEIIRLVGERTAVPVPPLRWLELDDSHVGSPFFVMERVDGIVPPDVMPYTFGSWVTEASPEDRRRLQDASVEVLARVHSIDLTVGERAFLEFDRPGDTPLRRHVQEQRAYYEWVVADDRPVPLLERTFDWLDAHWPVDDADAVVSWGDSRIGNILYRDFGPVAVLDWEMAGIGPREMDLGWMIFLHRFMQDLAETMELPGLPGFMRVNDVAATYEDLTGYAPRDLEFYLVYAALRHGVVMSRVKQRSVAFGQDVRPDDPDDMVMHRAALEAMLEGTSRPDTRTG